VSSAVEDPVTATVEGPVTVGARRGARSRRRDPWTQTRGPRMRPRDLLTEALTALTSAGADGGAIHRACGAEDVPMALGGVGRSPVSPVGANSGGFAPS
jgi:hypothetical protein